MDVATCNRSLPIWAREKEKFKTYRTEGYIIAYQDADLDAAPARFSYFSPEFQEMNLRRRVVKYRVGVLERMLELLGKRLRSREEELENH